MATPRLAIHLLGDFRVTVESREIDDREWMSRKARSLVKLLALAGLHRLHREHVMDQLWPAMGPEEAANNLHKALYVTRRILEPDLPRGGTSSYLQLRHGMLVLEAPGKLWIDVEAFEDAARVARELRTARAYTEALHLYTGDLVPEDRYEDWVAAYRERLRELRGTLLIGLAGVQEQAGDVAAAIETLQQVVAGDPVHEQAHGILMRLWIRVGQRHLALRQYQVLRAALQRELDVEPDARLQALYQDMRSGHPALGAMLPAHD